MKALVIGNGDYEDDDADLANAVNDAMSVGRALRAVGMAVTVETDLSLRRMEEAVADFVNGLDDSDQALFYYAGHAFELPGGGGERVRANYLIPTDFRARTAGIARTQAFRLDALTSDLSRRVGSLNLIILDACRDDPFTRGWSRSGASRGLAVVPTASLADTTAMWFATSPGQTAADSSEDPAVQDNSPFAVALVEALADEGQDPEFGEVFRRVTSRVDELTRGAQRPMKWENLRRRLYLSARFRERGAAPPPAEEHECPAGHAWAPGAERCLCFDQSICGSERAETQQPATPDHPPPPSTSTCRPS